MNEQEYMAKNPCDYCGKPTTTLKVTKEKRIMHLCDDHVKAWTQEIAKVNMAAFFEAMHRW